MKRLITYFFLFFAIISAKAQITYTIVRQDVTCNHQNLGDIEVNVTSTNPPYSYQWNTGDTINSIFNLNEGNYSVVITDGLVPRLALGTSGSKNV